MNDEHFGICLRRAREERALTLGDVAVSTKVPRFALELLESGTLSGLPANVFVRGFIRSYAKAVGIADERPLGLFDLAVGIKRHVVDAVDVKAEAAEKPDAPAPANEQKLAPLSNAVADDEDGNRRRGLSVAVFVIILVLIATITLSLLLRRPPQSGEGLSLRGGASGATLALEADRDEQIRRG